MAVLDKDGLTYFWGKVKTKLDALGDVLPIPQIEFNINANRDGGQILLGNNWTGYTSVTVVVKNNSEPTSASDGTVITTSSPIAVASNGVWYARAFPGAGESSKPSAAAVLTIDDMQCLPPLFSFSDSLKLVTLTAQTEGSVIRYTTDGTEPSEASSQYTAPVSVTVRSTFKAKAFKTGINPSPTITEELAIVNVFGVRWNMTTAISSLTRLTPSTDPNHYVNITISGSPNPGSSGASGSSPFDNYMPWKGMKRRNFSYSAPGVWEDETGFSTVASDVMVYIPEFYVKIIGDSEATYRYYYIADAPFVDFTRHPASNSYVAAYPMSTNYESKSGKTRLSNVYYKDYIDGIHENKGTSWDIMSIRQLEAIRFLYLVEFANFNSQSMIGSGPTVDRPTGGTDVVNYHTGVGTGGSIKYRNIEGLWNTQYEYVGEFSRINNTTANCYNKNVTILQVNTWIRKLLYYSDAQWIMGLPEAGGGTGGGNNYVCDYARNSLDYNNYAVVGRMWGDNEGAGLFFMEFYRSTTSKNTNEGVRLSYGLD